MVPFYQVTDIDAEGEENAADPNADPFAPLDKLYRMEKIKEELVKIRNTFKVAKDEGINYMRLFCRFSSKRLVSSYVRVVDF